MEGLRVEPSGKAPDFVGAEGVATGRENLADGDVLEEIHATPSGRRNSSICENVRSLIISSCSSSTSTLNLTKPRSGRLLETRLSSTVVRTRMRVPGRSGLTQRTSSTPGAPMELELST